MANLKAPTPTITHPHAQWALEHEDSSTINLTVSHYPDWPTETPDQAQQPNDVPVARDRHPYPNHFDLQLGEVSGGTHVNAELSRTEALRLYHVLGDALMWDGQ